MADGPWEEERRRKYEFHDLPAADITDHDYSLIRSSAVKGYVQTPERDNVKLIVSAFLDFLASRGYRVTKEKK